MSIADKFKNFIGLNAVNKNNANDKPSNRNDLAAMEAINARKERIIAVAKQNIDPGAGSKLNTSLFDNAIENKSTNKNTTDSKNDDDNTISSGDDTIEVNGKNKTIDAGEGNDAITLNKDSNGSEIKAGKGNDRIKVGSMAKDSKNTIKGGEGNDTVMLAGDASDYKVVKNKDGSKTYTNKANNAALTISADVENVDFKTDKKGETINKTGNYKTITTDDDNDKITIKGRSNNVDSGAGDDTVRFSSGSRGGSIESGEGDDNIFIDKITTKKGSLALAGGEGYDILSLAGPSSDYTIKEHQNGSKTYTHKATGTRIQVNSDIEDVKFSKK
jgi:hypothetical protein